MINWPKTPQMPQNLSAQILCLSLKVWDFDEKRFSLGVRIPCNESLRMIFRILRELVKLLCTCLQIFAIAVGNLRTHQDFRLVIQDIPSSLGLAIRNPCFHEVFFSSFPHIKLYRNHLTFDLYLIKKENFTVSQGLFSFSKNN